MLFRSNIKTTGFIPMGLTLAMYKLIRKGKNPVVLIFSMMLISILLAWLGILG